MTPSETAFAARHIGPSEDEQAKMLAVVGYGSRRELVDAAVPAGIRSDHVLALPPAGSPSVMGPESFTPRHAAGPLPRR